MKFLYYLPDQGLVTTSNAPEVFSRFGLTDILNGRSIECRGVDRGPDGNRGHIVLDGTAGETKIGYYPNEQRWRGCGMFWLGWTRGQPPGPVDLARDSIVPGYRTPMGDGHEWIIPIAWMSSDGDTQLPGALGWNAAGDFERTILPPYQQLFETASRIAETVYGEGGGMFGVDEAEGAAIAVEALAVNYHVGRHEVTALGLLTTHSMRAILGALVNLPAVLQFQKDLEKKTALANGSDSDSGEHDGNDGDAENGSA